MSEYETFGSIEPVKESMWENEPQRTLPTGMPDMKSEQLGPSRRGMITMCIGYLLAVGAVSVCAYFYTLMDTARSNALESEIKAVNLTYEMQTLKQKNLELEKKEEALIEHLSNLHLQALSLEQIDEADAILQMILFIDPNFTNEITS